MLLLRVTAFNLIVHISSAAVPPYPVQEARKATRLLCSLSIARCLCVAAHPQRRFWPSIPHTWPQSSGKSPRVATLVHGSGITVTHFRTEVPALRCTTSSTATGIAGHNSRPAYRDCTAAPQRAALRAGGLVFQPLSQPLLEHFYGRHLPSKAPPSLLAEVTEFRTHVDESIIVLSQVLAADTTFGYHNQFCRLHAVNGTAIRNIYQLARVCDTCTTEFVQFDIEPCALPPTRAICSLSFMHLKHLTHVRQHSGCLLWCRTHARLSECRG